MTWVLVARDGLSGLGINRDSVHWSRLNAGWPLCCPDALQWDFTCAGRGSAPCHPLVGGLRGRKGSVNFYCLM